MRSCLMRLTDIPLKRGGRIPKLTEVMEQFPDTKFNVDLKLGPC